MKEEQYNKLVDAIGLDKANNIREKLLEAELRKKDQIIIEAKKLAEMVDVMIPKEELVDGGQYNGHRWRNDNVAKWDSLKGVFVTINYTMGEYFIEEIPHFVDVMNTRLDGFIPFEKIEKINF
jgi:hypothetical protein